MELISIIKYEGSNEVFVHKSEKEDFNFGSQLIVHETQEALFLKDGKEIIFCRKSALTSPYERIIMLPVPHSNPDSLTTAHRPISPRLPITTSFSERW